ncbi:hypothetical protein Cri9333_2221 [Crinalium epipsammum PCC 9333]|uniref:Uncharacterized protein n=1 Tax=Crinalium epipsammum PCC 9333 TaxID=1173022 RepID=K9VYA4_9CYAN|nr:hypothetical protein [Crinalium epipsammum]AFZ13093.1 hypothetical protein Cri9333_2221 [Crinalium epipsammum PCC 9333]
MKGSLIRNEDLLPNQRENMYLLISTHFNGVKREVFDADLLEKNWVILLEDEKKALQGFSTLKIYETEFAGEVISAVYSGDTIVDPNSWSSSVLSKTWINSVNQLRQQYSKGKLYWLLICSGYRTYRFLPTFWNEFYPRYATPTPAKTEALLKFLARNQFGKYYDEERGVVRFPCPQILKNELIEIPTERLKNSHISFFLQKNPGYIQGDELVCLTEISEENLTSAGRKMWFAESSEGGEERGERREGLIYS